MPATYRLDALKQAASATASVVIVAAGNASRMGAMSERKPFLLLDGRTVLEVACAAFDAAASVAELVIVAHPLDVERVQRMACESSALDKCRAVLPGGAERSDSVRAGVQWTSFDVGVIAVHDAARPLVEPKDIERVIAAALQEGAAILATAVRDTLKSSADGKRCDKTVERAGLWCAQTPQAFSARVLRELVDRAQREGYSPTDEAALYERYRGSVALVEGSASNIKITAPEDVGLACALLQARSKRALPSARRKP
jgi:2-C-methyl-D-erythritol 4-phosphate cytidylyltransferase